MKLKGIKPLLYEMICSNGNKPYAYKLYGLDGIIETIEKPKINGDVTILQSHGYCRGCLPKVYMDAGLLFKYSDVKK